MPAFFGGGQRPGSGAKKSGAAFACSFAVVEGGRLGGGSGALMFRVLNDVVSSWLTVAAETLA